MPGARFLLPALSRFAGEALPATLAAALGRADRSAGAGGAESLFDILPRGWPVAAATRQAERGDAAGALWLRADPAYVRPDINGARLLALGDALQLDERAAESLLRALRPIFGDLGAPIEASTPGRWHVRLQPGAPLPPFTDPGQALGADLFDHLPAGDAGRRWRTLLSEAQVTLHAHPLNAERAAKGMVPVNSVWFWGAGPLPDHVTTPWSAVFSDDEAVSAFASLAKVRAVPVPRAWTGVDSGAPAFDLRRVRTLDALCAHWIAPAFADVRAKRLAQLDLVDEHGATFVLRRSQWLRFWRRPLCSLAPREDG
jgi:hypothetical protein